MTTARIRDFSKYGVLTDVDPYNLPTEAWSLGINVRFKNGSVVQAPVYRRVPQTLLFSKPRFVVSNIANTGFDSLFVGYLNGRVTEYKSATETDRSISGYVNSDADIPYTSCHLGDLLYINRGDRVPWYKTNIATEFSPFSAVAAPFWNSTWRAKILRACGSALVAFNMTEGASSFPTKIRTSEFALVGQVPADWDDSDPESNATSNVLSEMEGQIVDAQNLGDIMIIYGLNESWRMSQTGDANVWAYQKLPFSKGALNTNCAVEVGGKHYVFGLNDIWVHDGVSEKSIADLRVKAFVYSSINLQKAFRCHVVHDRNQKTISFNFVSGDRAIIFTVTDGCNRAAIYDYVNDTWSFDDLPFVHSGSMSNLDTATTYANATSDYTLGGTYLDQDDSLKKVVCFAGEASASFSLLDSLYAHDLQGPGSFVAFSTDTNANRIRVLEKDGLDLDGLPELEDNRGYKIASSIFPQARLESSAAPLEFSFGAADNYNQNVTFQDFQTYDGDVFTRCDFNEGGRYLFMKIRHNDHRWFTLTGLDVDVFVTGEE